MDIRLYNAAILRKGGVMVTRIQKTMCMCQMCMRCPASMPSLHTYTESTVDEAGAERTCFCFLRDERPRVKAVTGSGGRFLYTPTNLKLRRRENRT